MDFLLILIISMFVGPFIVGPILIRLKHRQFAHPNFNVISPHEFPESIREYFLEIDNQMKKLGFAHLVCFEITRMIPNMRSITAVYPQSSGFDLAMTVAIFRDSGAGERLGARYFEFSASTFSGANLCTNNCSVLMPWPGVPMKTVYQFPEIEEAARLFRVHTALLEQVHRFPDRKPAPFVDQLAVALSGAIEKDLNRRVDQGMLYYNHDQQTYLPTWKGACLMTWGLLWPVKPIRRWRRKARHQAILESLNV